MKKSIIISLLSILLITTGCSNKKVDVQSQTSSNTTSNTTSNTVTVSSNKEFTLDDLKKYNGQNGNPAYVAVDAIVYDVTNAKGWRNGKHEGGVTAGNDLTEEIKQSPHGKDVLKDLPVVGKLK